MIPTLRLIIAKNIKVIRTIRGLNQSQLAKRLMISNSYLCEVEKGNRKIKPSFLVCAAVALDTTPELLKTENGWESAK